MPPHMPSNPTVYNIAEAQGKDLIIVSMNIIETLKEEANKPLKISK